MSGEDYTVGHQLLLNLECLGFSVDDVVLRKVPTRALPQRYRTFRLDENMFSSGSGATAATEVVLYFIMTSLPWAEVANQLPCSGGMAGQRSSIIQRYNENVQVYLTELDMTFPCVETDQLSSFKKNATHLLELLKHILPKDMGHARRLLTESGHRMAWVCLRLSSIILQHQAIGKIEIYSLTGMPDTKVHQNVLKSQVVRESLKFQSVIEEYQNTENSIKEVTQILLEDYENAKLRKQTIQKQVTSSLNDNTHIDATVTSTALAKRKELLAAFAEVKEKHIDLEKLLSTSNKDEETLSINSLQQTWIESGGDGDLRTAVDDNTYSSNDQLDLVKLSSKWLQCLKEIHEYSSKVSRKKNSGISSIKVLVDECESQLPILKQLLSGLESQNTAMNCDLKPKLESELQLLRKRIQQHPLNSLIALETSRQDSFSTSPQPLGSCPLPIQQNRDTSPSSWLYYPSG